MTQAIETRKPTHLSVDQAQIIVAEAAHLYFESRRTRVDGFVDRRFSLFGSLALHRKALGWDMLKAPVNITLAVPYIGAQAHGGSGRSSYRPISPRGESFSKLRSAARSSGWS